jgi:hypothetical protein
VHRTTSLLGVPLAAVALAAVACGGGGTKAATAPPTTVAAGAAAYISCLTSHGYPPSPAMVNRINHPPTTNASGDTGGAPGGFGGGGFGGGGNGTTQTTLDPAAAQARQQALQACQSLAPAGLRFRGGGGSGAFLTQLRAYASCLNDHGYSKLLAALPAAPAAGQPPTSGAGQSSRQALQTAQSDPAFIAANQSCKALAPANLGNRGGGGTTTTTTTAS